jgi:hypothetical protein
MRHKLSFLFLLIFFSYSLFAQKIEISGTVSDSITHSPVEGVVVKALLNQKMIAFGTTNKSGKYNLGFENQTGMLTLNFQHISYNSKVQNTANRSQQLNVSLSSKTLMLREVSVATPTVIHKTDTVSFNVGSFKTAGDRSIEDVIKRLPGVEVNDDGKIAYQGKDISKFNIEGLDMLGGKYTLASRNVQVKDVSRVEMIENFQDIKQLRGKEYSNQVALNLKLTKEAQMRLLGTAELGGGVRGEDVLYHGVLTGMTFAKKLQFIGTLKANNYGNSLSGEVVGFYRNDNITNVMNGLMNSDLSSSPPLTANRFQQKNDLMTSLNSVLKITENVILRVNADYTRDQKQFQSEITSNYFVNNNNVEIKETQSPLYLKNMLKATVDLQVNSSKIYIDNAISFVASNVDNHFGVITGGNSIQQNVTNNLKGIQNRFNFFKKTNKRQYNFASLVSYSDMPDNRLTISGAPGVTGEFYQAGRGTTFATSNSTSFGYDLSRVSQLSLSLSLNAKYDRIYTHLQRGDSSILNRNQGLNITTSISPVYRLQSLNQRYGLTIGLPVNFYNLAYLNRLNPNADFYYNMPFFSPKIDGHYIFSAFTKLEFNSGINNSIGDITDFVVNPIQTSYNQQTAKSGILAKSSNFSSRLSFEFKKPVEMFFSDCSVMYSTEKRNILGSQTVNAGATNVGISTSGIADENTSESISARGTVTKVISAIGTKLNLNSSYGISSGVQIRQGIKTDINSTNFRISPDVNTRISKHLEISYSFDYSLSSQQAVNFTTTYHQQSHNISVSYNPVEALIIYGNMDFSRREISTDNYKNMQLFDAGIRYKRKQFEAELKLNNLLNTKEYSYTVVNQLDVFSYKYYLNPREVLLIFKFNL